MKAMGACGKGRGLKIRPKKKVVGQGDDDDNINLH